MSVRFPHHGSGRHEKPSPTGLSTAEHESAGAPLPRDTQEDVPGRACCCPAKPVVKVVMPANSHRSTAVDLWLCGHHWRASRQALAEAGADIFDVSAPSPAADGKRTGAAV